MNNIESKRSAVIAGDSKIFKEWSSRSNITEEDFIEALEWVCADPLNADGKMTREIGLTPTGILKLFRGYGACGLCAFYDSNGNQWCGATFTRAPKDEHEELFAVNGLIEEKHMITLSCKDRV